MLICVDGFRARDYRETVAELVPELAQAGGARSASRRCATWSSSARRPSCPGCRTLADVMAAAEPFEPVPVSAADDAFILYTSGSSARPKAVPMQQYA